MRKGAIFAFSFSAVVLLGGILGVGNVIWLAVPFFVLSCVFALSESKRQTVLFIALSAASVALLWCFVFDTWVLAPVRYYDGLNREVEARVVDYASDYKYGKCVQVRVDGILAQMYVKLDDDSEFEPMPGDILRATADCRSTEDEKFAHTIAARGVHLFIYADCVPKTVSQNSNSLLYLPRRIGGSVKSKISEIFPPDAAAFMQAILTGDRTELYKDEYFSSMLSVSGINHIVAVSGMHVSFLVGFMMLFFGKRKKLSLLAAPVIVLFMAMVGFTPSVTRAGIMQLLLLFSPFLMREYDSATSLGLSLFVILAVNPRAIFSPGLQMSYGAVAGILIFYDKFLIKIKTKKNSGLIKRALYAAARTVFSALAVTLSAQVFVIPLSAVYYRSVSIISPLTNILILWAVSLIFCIGALAVILGFIYTPLGAAAAAVPAILYRYIRFIAELFGGLGFSSLTTDNFYVAVWLVTLYLLLVLVMLSKEKFRWLFFSAPAALLLAAAIILSSADARRSAMEVTALDVGQGQCCIVTSGRSVYVVDCGGSIFGNEGDIAADYIHSRGFSHIDALILTHFHDDHAGGAAELLRRIPTEKLYIPSIAEDAAAQDIIDEAGFLGTEVICIEDICCINGNPGPNLTLYPPVGVSGENELGLSALFSLDEYDALFVGDMGGTTEQVFIELFDLPPIELLIVGHHGSKYSTSEDFLDALMPQTALISVGENSYGHPAPELLSRLDERSIKTYRTDLNGNITVRLGKRGRGLNE